MINKRKLSESGAVSMRELYASGGYTIRELAKKYCIAPVTAWKILRGYSYQKVTGGEAVNNPDGKNVRKQKALKGNDHPLHILTDDDVMTIRHKIAEDGVYGKKMALYADLAENYNVSVTTIASISTSSNWKHLPSVEEIRAHLRDSNKQGSEQI